MLSELHLSKVIHTYVCICIHMYELKQQTVPHFSCFEGTYTQNEQSPLNAVNCSSATIDGAGT